MILNFKKVLLFIILKFLGILIDIIRHLDLARVRLKQKFLSLSQRNEIVNLICLSHRYRLCLDTICLLY